MRLYDVKNFSFKYSSEENFALKDISFFVEKGEFIVLCGKSGSGKTTLLRQLKASIASKGEKFGEILFNGKKLSEINQREDAEKIGFVGQDPESSVVTDKVWKELSFGMESLGYKSGVIRSRVSEISSFFGLQDVFFNDIRELSGGQIQMVNIAASMVLDPDVIILDEPSSRLDPLSAERLFNQLKKINRELGITIIISEHRLDELVSVSDRILLMNEGQIIYDGKPEALSEDILKGNDILLFPQIMQIFFGAGDKGECPLNTVSGRTWLKSKRIYDVKYEDNYVFSDDKIISVKEAWFKYKNDSLNIIKGANLDIYKGEIYSVLGGNGAGKTTLLSLILGINKPYEGKVKVKDGIKLGYLPQNPCSIFVEDRIFDDFMLLGKSVENVLDIASVCGISEILQKNPYDISGGEKERIALAKILLTDPDVLILDEPTQGLDGIFKYSFGKLLRKLCESGKTILIVSHDIDFCAEFSDRCGLFFGGEIISSDCARAFFNGNNFYTTQAKKIAKDIIPEAITVEDVLLALRKERKIKEEKKEIDSKIFLEKLSLSNPKEKSTSSIKVHNIILILTFCYLINVPYINEFFAGIKLFNKLYEMFPMWNHVLGLGLIAAELIYILTHSRSKNYIEIKKNKISGKSKLVVTILFLSVPVTVIVGMFLLGSRAYLGVSLAVIAELVLGFMILFEKRKPESELIVMVSFMCALAIAGRVVFFALPQFKPIGAVVIISAAAFGSSTGFLVGAVSILVSNLFFGQGPWTPWQMLAFGLIGFISGIVFEKGVLKPNKVSMMILGGILTIAVYGGIINPSSVIMYNPFPTKSMIVFSYLSGLSFDIIHAASTMFFVWILGEPILNKINRIKKKYELYM